MAAASLRRPAALLAAACLLCSTLAPAHAQLVSVQYSPCLESAPQAPADQLLNISRVYAQLDVGRGSSDIEADNPGHQSLLRLVALGETGVRSEGFSNETNFLATLVVESSILSFVPHSNQTSLCSNIITAAQLIDSNSNITAGDFPDPGGCPYGPGPIMMGYAVPLGDIGLDDYYPLSTLSTRLRVLDTSVPPLQLACIDVYSTPYYETAASAAEAGDHTSTIYDVILWLPIATFIGYILANVLARVYAAMTLTREEREAALASSLTVKLTDPSTQERTREVLLETAIGRSVIRSRSLTRYVTPSVGDVLGIFQWIAMVGMCSVVWQGYAYPIFSRLSWSMLVFNTTIVSPSSDHADPAYSIDSYPPGRFRYNSEELFTTVTSPFYFSPYQTSSNLLNIPSTGAYNTTNITDAAIYPSEDELQGMASFSAMVGLRPQDLFANSLTFLAFLLAAVAVLSLLPIVILFILRLCGVSPQPKVSSRHSANPSQDSEESSGSRGGMPTYELARAQMQSTSGRGEIDSQLDTSSYRGSGGKGSHPPEHRGDIHDGRLSGLSHKYAAAPTTPGRHSGSQPSPYFASEQEQQRLQQQRTGIHHWWAGGDKTRESHARDELGSVRSSTLAVSSYYSTRAWLALCQGLVVRLVFFFHLPITIFSVYQMAHATTTSSVISTVFAALVFCIFSIAIPVYLVFRIRKILTRYLQDDTNTLLALGPIYNTYAQDSYTFAAVRFTANLIEGCVVGGAQSRATVQVSVILVVEIVETLVTSIWLPWGDGAAQGPLQFILSVSRIITAVLLIVISPAVNLSFTARGWIGYVIILLQALIILMIVFILLVKIAELVFRMVAKIDFDESRSTRHTGLLGALRKKEILAGGTRRRKRKSSAAGFRVRKPDERLPQATLPHDTEASIGPDRTSRVSFGGQAGYDDGYLTPSNRLARAPYSTEHDDDSEHIMSAFQSRPTSTMMGSGYHAAGYLPPGTYSAPASGQQAPHSGFRVVRGGRATDASPYTVSHALPPAGGDGYYSDTSGQAGQSHTHPAQAPGRTRPRAASQSATVEESYAPATSDNPEGPASPSSPSWNRRRSAIETSPITGSPSKADRRLSAPLPSSPSTFPSGAPSSSAFSRPQISRQVSGGNAAPTWRRESSTGSGFFTHLFRGTTKSEENEDGWSDSDDSEDGRNMRQANKKRWIFGKGKSRPRPTSGFDLQEEEQYEEDPEWQAALADADEGEDGQGAGPSSGKSFQVIRKPPPGPRNVSE